MNLLPCFLLLGVAAAQGPEQPIAFSHKQHAGNLKIECKTCHSAPDPGEKMTYPDESTCMSCHATVKADSEEIRKLAQFAEKKERVPWAPVYTVPTFVFWSHKTHLAWGAKCSDCHGDVASRDRLFVEKPVSMANCMACHRANKASNDCTLCHEQLN